MGKTSGTPSASTRNKHTDFSVAINNKIQDIDENHRVIHLTVLEQLDQGASSAPRHGLYPKLPTLCISFSAAQVPCSTLDELELFLQISNSDDGAVPLSLCHDSRVYK